MSKRRVFVIPVGSYLHPKAPEGTPLQFAALINLKRLMPPKLKQFEGKAFLFGGLQNPDETDIETVTRELREEMPLIDLEQSVISGSLTCVVDLPDYGIYAVALKNRITEDLVRSLASTCREGLLDVRFEGVTFDDWISNTTRDSVNTAIENMKVYLA